MRELRLRRVLQRQDLDPNNVFRDKGSPAPPDLDKDYEPIDLAQLIDEQLDIAQLTIEPSYYCSLSCQFCELPIDSKIQLDWDKAKPIIQLLRLGGLRWAVLAGGEPGIAPRLLEILSDLRSLGVRATMLTHGMWAANKTYLEKVIDAGLCEVNMSIKSVDNARFKTLCGSGSFDRQLKGLTHLSDMVGVNRFDRLMVNYVVTCDSEQEIERLYAHLKDKNLYKLILTCMEPYSERAMHLAPDMRTMDAVQRTIIDLAESLPFPVDVEGFPMCYVSSAQRQFSAKQTSPSRDEIRLGRRIPKYSLSPKADADYLSIHYGYQRYLQYAKPAQCAPCALSANCPGIHQLLVDRIVPRPISIS